MLGHTIVLHLTISREAARHVIKHMNYDCLVFYFVFFLFHCMFVMNGVT